jgi:hypothetical protein
VPCARLNQILTVTPRNQCFPTQRSCSTDTIRTSEKHVQPGRVSWADRSRRAGRSAFLHHLVQCRETDPNWAEDLEEDTKEEVERQYGKLERLVVDKQSQVSTPSHFRPLPVDYLQLTRMLIPGGPCLHEVC